MIRNAKVLALITARGGSKGLPRKNILPLGGQPLIAWTIQAAKRSKLIDRLILSSDDSEIIAISKTWGCEAPFVRPAELASDTAPSLDVIHHALRTIGEPYDYVVLLQPTSPLRTSEDIDGCIQLCVAREATTCASISAVDKPPYWMFTKNDDDRLLPLFPITEMPRSRQAAPMTYLLNGAVYVARTDHLLKGGELIVPGTVGYLMSAARSLDIDTPEDLATLEKQLRHATYTGQRIE